MNTEPIESTRFAPSTWLRWLGTTTFLAASVSFLVEGWTDAGELCRELSWSAVTLALTVLGILAARRWRDARGARVFLGLAAATIPAHFAEVGGQTWSYVQEGMGNRLGLLVGGGLLLLLGPPLALGISALVRRRGPLLTALLFVLSCPLLLPSRNGDVAAGLAMAEVLALALLELRVLRHDAALQTIEGAAARTLLLFPCGILLVRHAFYTPTHLWTSALVAAPSIVLLTLPRVSPFNPQLTKALQYAGVVGLFCATCLAGLDLRVLGLSLSIVGLVGTETTDSEPKVFATIGAVIFGLASLVAAIWPSTTYLLLLVPVGTMHALSAYQRRSALLVVATSMCTMLGVVGQLAGMIRLPAHDYWVLPAIFGIGLLVLASLFEHHRSRVNRLVSRFSSHFGEPSR